MPDFTTTPPSAKKYRPVNLDTASDEPVNDQTSDLMQHNDGASSRRGGSGSSSRRRATKQSRTRPTGRTRTPDDEHGDVRPFRVAGLSMGTRQFYARSTQGEARKVLQKRAIALVTDAVQLQAERDRARLESKNRSDGRQRTGDVVIYGLATAEVDALRLVRGAARRVLTDHAWQSNPALVRRYDRESVVAGKGTR